MPRIRLYIQVSGDVTIGGSLTVLGSTTVLNVTTSNHARFTTSITTAALYSTT